MAAHAASTIKIRVLLLFFVRSLREQDVGILPVQNLPSIRPGRWRAVFRIAQMFTEERKDMVLEAVSYRAGVCPGIKNSSNPSDPYNRAFGADVNFILWKELTLNGYWAKSQSSQVTLQHKDSAYSSNLDFTNNWMQFLLERSRVDANFNPEVGFVNRTDLVTNYAKLEFTPRPKSGPVREYNFQGWIYYQPSTEGVLQTQ